MVSDHGSHLAEVVVTADDPGDALCPPHPVKPTQRYDREITQAGKEIDAKYGKNMAYGGMIYCVHEGRLVLFRIPGDTAFDEGVTAIAHRWHLAITLIDSKYSAAQLQEAQEEVRARRGDLARVGAPFVSTTRNANGNLTVAVEDNADKAREVLASLGDKIIVITLKPATDPQG
jgi:hypothetical protein